MNSGIQIANTKDEVWVMMKTFLYQISLNDGSFIKDHSIDNVAEYYDFKLSPDDTYVYILAWKTGSNNHKYILRFQ